jgi:type IV pilus assembly protein PilY1
MRWPGNVKKYKLASNGDILDANGDSAVGSNGFFRSGRRSFWTPSGTTDGEDVAKGGAASQMPAPGSRKIYTNATSETSYATSDSSLTSRNLSDLKTTGTGGFTATKQNTLFGLSTTCTRTSPIASPSCPSGDQLIDWAYGMDVADLVPRNGNNNYTEARKDMGDPLHGRPSVVIYGGTTSTKDIDDARVYAVTNDGYLHSFDAKTGAEQWAFVPYNQLQRLLRVYQNNTMNPRAPLGLDGTIRVLKIDKCFDGVIEPANVTCGNDRVYIFFGMRRGGNYYYALDVSYKDAPKLLWMAGPGTDSTLGLTQLPLVGQTWSTPTVTRAAVPGKTQNSDKYVLVFGGGYDAAKEDGTAAKAYVTDTVGTAIYMVDAINGTLLWRAAPSGVASSDGINLSSMTNAIPADVRAIDFTSDGLVDVMYAADLGGRVWRFDVDNSAGSTSAFIKGGVFANLGGSGIEGARRFFVAPDVSFVKQGSSTWFNIALGSGNRELPVTDTTTDDKFYSLRDYNKLTPYKWDGTDTGIPITDADLTDVTPTTALTCDTALPPNCTTTYQRVTVPSGGPGWKFPLNYFDGEKVVTESRTFENTVFFSSFYPKVRTGSDDTDSDSCTTTKGYNNFYAISAFDGSPCASCIAGLVAKGKTAIAAGTGVILKQPGIAPEPVFLFPTPDGTSTTRVPPVCLVGAESCGSFSSYEPKRTYWWQKGAE